jgi:hypothetical protein
MKSTAFLHSPVNGSTTSRPLPLKSMKVFSPAWWACRIVADSGLAQRWYLSQNWLYWRPSGVASLYSCQSSILVTCRRCSSRWT